MGLERFESNPADLTGAWAPIDCRLFLLIPCIMPCSQSLVFFDPVLCSESYSTLLAMSSFAAFRCCQWSSLHPVTSMPYSMPYVASGQVVDIFPRFCHPSTAVNSWQELGVTLHAEPGQARKDAALAEGHSAFQRIRFWDRVCHGDPHSQGGARPSSLWIQDSIKARRQAARGTLSSGEAESRWSSWTEANSDTEALEKGIDSWRHGRCDVTSSSAVMRLKLMVLTML